MSKVEQNKSELSYENEYQFQTEKGSKVAVKIETKIEDLCKEDLEEILHEYVIRTRNFYLSLGKKIAGMD